MRAGVVSVREGLAVLAATAVAGVLFLAPGRDGAWTDDVGLGAVVASAVPQAWPVRLRVAGPAEVSAGGAAPVAVGSGWRRFELRPGQALDIRGQPGEAVQAVLVGPPGSSERAGSWSLPPDGHLRLLLNGGRAAQGVRAILPR